MASKSLHFGGCRSGRVARRGTALILCLFVVVAFSLLVVRVFDDQTVRRTATRNVADYERALYLAGAAVHHGLALLESDFSYRGTVTDGAYPGDNTYSATVTDGVDVGTVLVTGTGVSGGATRRLQATVGQGS